MKKPFLDWDCWIKPAPIGVKWLDCAIGSALLSQLSNHPEHEWRDFIDRNRKPQGGSISDDFRNWFTGNFDGIRAIHATRLPGLLGVKQNGLRAWSALELEIDARARFGKHACDHEIASAINDCRPDLRQGRVHLFSGLSEALGLYSPSNGKLPPFAVHGSEFRECVRSRLGLPAIAEQGQAYLLVCHLAWSKIAPDVVDKISWDALDCILIAKHLSSHNFSLRTLESVSTTQNIQPSEIVEYANVDALVGRGGLSISDIKWQSFKQ